MALVLLLSKDAWKGKQYQTEQINSVVNKSLDEPQPVTRFWHAEEGYMEHITLAKNIPGEVVLQFQKQRKFVVVFKKREREKPIFFLFLFVISKLL